MYTSIFTITADLVFLICVINSFLACFPVDPDPHCQVRLKNVVHLSLLLLYCCLLAKMISSVKVPGNSLNCLSWSLTSSLSIFNFCDLKTKYHVVTYFKIWENFCQTKKRGRKRNRERIFIQFSLHITSKTNIGRNIRKCIFLLFEKRL